MTLIPNLEEKMPRYLADYLPRGTVTFVSHSSLKHFYFTCRRTLHANLRLKENATVVNMRKIRRIALQKEDYCTRCCFLGGRVVSPVSTFCFAKSREVTLIAQSQYETAKR